MTKKEWQKAEKKSHKTGKMANTLVKAIAKRYAYRWKFQDFRSPLGRESAGIVDVIAIRKCGKTPKLKGLKKLDLFDIYLIQVKGGSAPRPPKDDVDRLKIVGKYYHAEKIVLFEWRKGKNTIYSFLNNKNKWEKITVSELFG